MILSARDLKYKRSTHMKARWFSIRAASVAAMQEWMPDSYRVIALRPGFFCRRSEKSMRGTVIGALRPCCWRFQSADRMRY